VTTTPCGVVLTRSHVAGRGDSSPIFPSPSHRPATTILPKASPWSIRPPPPKAPCQLVPPSFLFLRNSSPSIHRAGEPLSSQPPPFDSLWGKLPPQLLLLCHLAAGWPESAGGAVPVMRGKDLLFRLVGLKGFNGPNETTSAEWAKCIVDRAQLHSAIYYFPSELFF
jgi:hypothetical protein